MGTITIEGVSPLVRKHIGLLAGAETYKPYPFLEIFKKAQILPMTDGEYIEFDYVKDIVTTAELNKRANSKNTAKVKEPEFRRVQLTPGEIFNSQSLTATELNRMQAGKTQVITIGGQAIDSSEQVSRRKLQRIRESISSRMNIMCTQLFNDGVVRGKDDAILWDFNLPEKRKATYSAAEGFLKLVKKINREYIKINGGMPADGFLIGSEIADKILEDEKLQDTMYKLGMTDIGKDLTADEKSRIIGVFMGQMLKEMPYSFDENGADIIGGNIIKLYNTQMLARGYAGIEIKNENGLPD